MVDLSFSPLSSINVYFMYFETVSWCIDGCLLSELTPYILAWCPYYYLMLLTVKYALPGVSIVAPIFI